MSKFDKLIEDVLSLSKDIRFDQLKKVLESYGYEGKKPKSGSSHWTFRKKGCKPITVPQHKPIKRVYIELVRDMILEETDEED